MGEGTTLRISQRQRKPITSNRAVTSGLLTLNFRVVDEVTSPVGLFFGMDWLPRPLPRTLIFVPDKPLAISFFRLALVV